MIKRVVLIVVAIVIVFAMLGFTSVNSGTIDINLLFTSVTTSIPVAFTVAFAFGWGFGLLCMAAWAVKLVNERRTLRRALRVSESEVSSLRNLPLTDAD